MTVGSVAAVMVVPAVLAAYQRPKVLPEVNAPDVCVSVPNVEVLTPNMKAFAPVLIKPDVKVRVPETVPVTDPDKSEFAPEKVTPEALELLIVSDVKFAVGDADRLRNVPAPEIVCALEEALRVIVVPEA